MSDLSTEELAQALDALTQYAGDDATLNACAARLRELQAEVERLTNGEDAWRNVLPLMAAQYQAERALADQLAEALRGLHEWMLSIGGHHAEIDAALAAWEAARSAKPSPES